MLVALLAAPLLAGCLGPEPVEPAEAPGATPLDLASLTLPAGAFVEATARGALVTLRDVPLPFEQRFTIPEGVTLVRLTAAVPEGLPILTHMRNADTDRRRCNANPVEDGWAPRLSVHSCSALTAVDDLPAEWVLRAWSARAPSAHWLTIELVTAPVDGLAALLDLDALAKPVHDLLPTEEVWIEAHDGARLYAQLTRPAVDGPVPVIVSSSPYNGPQHAAGNPSMWAYFVKDWAKRGYAVLSADVRGTGRSTGCMEVWGPNEQRDQAMLVEWAAAQSWSDGNVGFYGQSYVGTTPTQAAVLAPPALKAIIAVAPVINAYDDWHFGGVPNGENVGSPIGYQSGTGFLENVEPARPQYLATNAVSGFCDPALTARANDPRAIYDAFYAERNFSARAKDVRAAVLYTQGFEDTNVKSTMAVHWFHALPGPKLGLFGHWAHQHPARPDQEVLFLAWMEQHLKGKAVGVDRLPNADLLTNAGTHRFADAWPPRPGDEGVRTDRLHADFAAGALSPRPASGSARVLSTPTPLSLPALQPALPSLALEGSAVDGLALSGTPHLRLKVSLEGARNAHVAAYLYEVEPQGRATLVTFGMFNLAHHRGHDRYEPLSPGQTVEVSLPMLPTEYVFARGNALRLVVRAAHHDDWFLVQPGEPGVIVLHADGTALELPVADGDLYRPLPESARL
ncbi:MAG TPA: CocE/NonD family hydrolase [Candidatus Thermoplasmatota archaeon]|nr:CocE/NonD family hydrolase [Candidatus Thermoplasmatota archaeon]